MPMSNITLNKEGSFYKFNGDISLLVPNYINVKDDLGNEYEINKGYESKIFNTIELYNKGTEYTTYCFNAINGLGRLISVKTPKFYWEFFLKRYGERHYSDNAAVNFICNAFNDNIVDDRIIDIRSGMKWNDIDVYENMSFNYRDAEEIIMKSIDRKSITLKLFQYHSHYVTYDIETLDLFSNPSRYNKKIFEPLFNQVGVDFNEESLLKYAIKLMPKFKPKRLTIRYEYN